MSRRFFRFYEFLLNALMLSDRWGETQCEWAVF